MKSKIHYKDDKKFGEKLTYYPFNKVKRYYYYNTVENIVFKASYDKYGNVYKLSGTAFPYINLNDDTLSVGDIFKVDVRTIDPPLTGKSLSKYRVSYYGGEEQETWSVNKPNTTTFSFERKLDKKGVFLLELEMDLYSNDNDSIIHHSNFKAGIVVN